MNSKPEIMRKRLPVGISDFKKLRKADTQYVDKSEFIWEIIDAAAEVILLPRPRRFGKTLNLSMLRYFLEKSDEDHRTLFDGLKIREHECFDRHQGKYPVIWLTFKDLKTSSWEDMLQALKGHILNEIERHYPTIREVNVPGTALMLRNLEDAMAGNAPDRVFEDSLLYLTTLLSHACENKPVVLIDEYDTPLHAGYQGGFYENVIRFIRNFLSGGLKDNPHISKGVITGILRVAKESVFSGLNNLGVYTLLNKRFTESFGFTESEVKKLLKEYGMADRHEEVSQWYNGYRFGNTIIYNPWSVLSYVDNEGEAEPYWSNTADASMIERLATRGGKEIREEIGKLLEGETIERPIYETLVMKDLDRRDDLIWSFLLFSGYLKTTGDAVYRNLYPLTIPNEEVKIMYEEMVIRWFSEKTEANLLLDMIRALEKKDIPLFESHLRRIVKQVMSYHDFGGESEKVYHALVLGMLVWMSGQYDIRSNRESGMGRFDLMLKPKNFSERGIILEFKIVESSAENAHEQVLKDALQQIEEKSYVTELEAAGITEVLKIAVAFRGKELWVSAL